jgi:rod shape-determining protein MreC
MNKKLFGFLFILSVLIFGAAYYTNFLQSPLIRIAHQVQSLYLSSVTSISEAIERHIAQTQHIQELQDKLRKYQKNHLVMQQLAAQVEQLFRENNSTLRVRPNVELVRAISYVKFGNMNKLWLEMPDFNASQIYGLVYHERVAGIVVAKNGKPMALLNQDPDSSYAVFIGKKHAPGIAHGNNDGGIVVDYVPLWLKIEVGDTVITSGLDKLFFRGLKVGKVISVKKTQGYQQAIVKPYFLGDTPTYFYVIRRVY